MDQSPPNPDRFALGTYDIVNIGPSILDTKTGDVYVFGEWAAAQAAIAEMRAADDPLYYAPVPFPRPHFFTECAPGVEGARP
jgi:hypothetical protein